MILLLNIELLFMVLLGFFIICYNERFMIFFEIEN